MASFTFERQIAAPPQTVFAILTEHANYAAVTELRKSGLEREGTPPPNGVGAIRMLSSVEPPLREELIAYEPTVPLVGGVVVAVAKQAVGTLVKGICTESERRAAAPS